MRSRLFLLLATAYVASSLSAATGEAGSPHVHVQALFNRDASTDLAINTNGTIARLEMAGIDVQVDAPKRLDVRLHNLLPEDLLHVRTYVWTGDPNHHYVVDLEEPVRRRPDLVVSEIIAPPHTVAGVPTIIRATIRERNGDLGAQATCRLFADHVEIDRAENIRVDPGATVQCAFAPIFDLPGTQQLAVVVDGVEPGDWDDASNASALATIQISDGASGGFSAGVREEAFTSQQRISHVVRHIETVAQSFRFDAWLRQGVTFVATMSATSGGETLFAGETPVAKPNGARCAVTFGDFEATACDLPRLGVTRIDLFRGNGELIYRSNEWSRHFATIQLVDSAPPLPIAARFANHVEMNVTLGRFAESLTIPLHTSAATWDATSEVLIHEKRSTLAGLVAKTRKGGFALK